MRLHYIIGALVVACLVVSSSQASLLDTQALFSFAAYCPFNQIQSWTCYWCKNAQIPTLTVVDAIYNENADTSGFIGYHDNIIQIAYRGTITLSLIDWIDDLEFAKRVIYKNMPGVEVHEGFLKVYNSLAPQMWAAFKKTQCNEIHVTGHSLGAAVATIAAVELKNMTSLAVRLTNYGSPRTGNHGFYNYVTKILPDAVRVVHASDVVPHLPLEMMGFHHIATEVWQHNGRLQVCDNTGEDPNCSDSIWVPSIPDHISYMNYDLLDGLPDCGGIFDVEPPSASLVQAIRNRK